MHLRFAGNDFRNTSDKVIRCKFAQWLLFGSFAFQVRAVNADGTYDIDYDIGDFEEAV